MRKIGTSLLKRAARGVNGTSITVRVESTMLLTDIQSTYSHYVLKSALILERIPREHGAAAQRTARATTISWAQRAGSEQRFATDLERMDVNEVIQVPSACDSQAGNLQVIAGAVS